MCSKNAQDEHSPSLGVRGFIPPTQLLMILMGREYQVFLGYLHKCNNALLPVDASILEYHNFQEPFCFYPGPRSV